MPLSQPLPQRDLGQTGDAARAAILNCFRTIPSDQMGDRGQDACTTTASSAVYLRLLQLPSSDFAEHQRLMESGGSTS